MKKTKTGEYFGLLGIAIVVLAIVLLLDLPKVVLFVLAVGVIVNALVIEVKYKKQV